MYRSKKQLKLLIKKIQNLEGRFADKITSFSGSMLFIYLHIAWFLFWFIYNSGFVSLLTPFDPFPYGLLTMIVSLEAIFLSTLIMVSQNRQALIDKVRDIEDDLEGEEMDVEVSDIQNDLDEIKRVINVISKKIETK